MAVASTRPRWQLPDGRIHPWMWAPVALLVVWSDYHAGLRFFPLLYTVPVALAAWYSGAGPAVALALVIPLTRLLMIWLGFIPEILGLTLVLEILARGVVVLFLGLWLARLAELERALERRVRVLEGLLPICSFCKKIRNDSGDWERLEAYISHRSDASFSHGVCPVCWEAHYARDMADTPASSR